MDFSKSHKLRHPKLIQDGDLVVIYIRHDSLDHLYVKKGKTFNNKFGAFHHDDIIGKPFGSKIKSKISSGWLYVLEPTPELWSMAVHTRTQIVNEVDSSVITFMLNVHVGDRVVESGTGSGCMTLALARAVHPTGHIFTYEFNNVRAKTATEEFQRLKVDHLITVQHHDVCGKYLNNEEAGFIGVEENSIDAVFLDLPEPWLAIEHAHKVLKPGKNICCYSPCIEQVMHSHEKLRALGFHSIRMIEVRQRPFDGRVVELETLDLGLEDKERIENEKSMRDPELYHYHYQPKPKSDASDLVNSTIETQNKSEQQLAPKKRRKIQENQEDSPEETANSEVQDDTMDEDDAVGESEGFEESEVPHPSLIKRIRNRPQSSVNGNYHMHAGRPVFTMKGHTAFLTFAIKSCSK